MKQHRKPQGSKLGVPLPHPLIDADREPWDYAKDAPLEGAAAWKQHSKTELIEAVLGFERRLADTQNLLHDARIRAEGAEARLIRTAPLYDAIRTVMRTEVQPLIVEAFQTSFYVSQEPPK